MHTYTLNFLCLLFIADICIAEYLFDVENILDIIIDICDTYKISSVLFSYANDIEDFQLDAILYIWKHKLSRRSILTSNLHVQNLDRTSFYYKRILRPLYVVILADEKSVMEFSKVTQEIDMSFPIWLVIFLQAIPSIQLDFCHDPPGNIFNVAFNTEMMVLCHEDSTLREWYSLHRNRTEIIDLAVWQPTKGFVWSADQSPYKRRNNLEGRVFRAILVKGNPFIAMRNNKFVGFYGEALNELTSMLNFSVKVVKEVIVYGSYHPFNKSWNGAIAEVVAGHADIALADFAMTTSRMNVIAYMSPLKISKDCLFIKEQEIDSIHWTSYFEVFDERIWIVIGTLLIIGPIVITFMKKENMKFRMTWGILINNYLSIWSIFCQQGIPSFPQNCSLRIAYFTIIMTTLIIWSIYSALLTSHLAVQFTNPPFSTIEEFINDGTYKLIVEQNSADYDEFVNVQNRLSKRIIPLMEKPDKLPKTMAEAYHRVCTEDKIVYYTSCVAMWSVSLELPCKIRFIETGRFRSIAMILPKNNQFANLFISQIVKFFDNGMRMRFMGHLDKSVHEKPVIPFYTPVSVWSITPIIAILVGGALLSICLITIEKYDFNQKINVRKFSTSHFNRIDRRK